MPHYRRNIIVLCCTIFLSSMSWQQVIPFLPQFLKEIGGAQNFYLWVTILTVVQSAASMIAQPFWGKLGDVYGRKPMIVRAGICLTGVYFGMSICQNPLQLTFFRVLNGALTGFVPGSFALIATNTPEQLAPRYVASAQIASSAGLILGPVIGSVLAELFGFRVSMRISGYACLLCTLAVLALVKEPNKSKITEKTSLAQDFAIALGSKIQRPIILAVMLNWFYGAAISPYLIPYIESLSDSLPGGFSGIVFSLPAAAFVFTARAWTSVGEKKGFHRSIAIGATGAAVATALLTFMPGIWSFAAMYLIAGLWLAAVSPSTGALTCTKVEESFRGRAYGIQHSLGTFASLLAPILAGFVGARFGMQYIFVMVGIVFILGTMGFRGLARRAGAKAEV